jgi:hypothetical protein
MASGARCRPHSMPAKLRQTGFLFDYRKAVSESIFILKKAGAAK